MTDQPKTTRRRLRAEPAIEPLLKVEAEKSKNKQYYMERGAHIHKRKLYDIPGDVFKENIIGLSIADLRNVYFKIQLYVDNLLDMEQKPRASQTINQLTESEEPDECVIK